MPSLSPLRRRARASRLASAAPRPAARPMHAGIPTPSNAAPADRQARQPPRRRPGRARDRVQMTDGGLRQRAAPALPPGRRPAGGPPSRPPRSSSASRARSASSRCRTASSPARPARPGRRRPGSSSPTQPHFRDVRRGLDGAALDRRHQQAPSRPARDLRAGQGAATSATLAVVDRRRARARPGATSPQQARRGRGRDGEHDAVGLDRLRRTVPAGDEPPPVRPSGAARGRSPRCVPRRRPRPAARRAAAAAGRARRAVPRTPAAGAAPASRRPPRSDGGRRRAAAHPTCATSHSAGTVARSDSRSARPA